MAMPYRAGDGTLHAFLLQANGTDSPTDDTILPLGSPAVGQIRSARREGGRYALRL